MFSFDTPIVPISDDGLLAALPGFSEHHIEANGTWLHAVIGGSGDPLVLLPGWPMTWWEYRKVLPELAKHFRVIVIDLRGMGASAKPMGGYDKKIMADDIAGVLSALGMDRVHIVGSDIGAMVAYSFAANHPARTRSLTLIDTPHPFEGFRALPLMPLPGTFNLADVGRPLHPWWFAFSQVPDLPELIFAGRFAFFQDWIIDYLSHDARSVSDHDRAIFALAYEDDASIRAALAWFRAFDQDISDFSGYAPLQMPVLGVGGIGHDFLSMFLEASAPGARLVRLAKSGHWIALEQPEALIEHVVSHVRAT